MLQTQKQHTFESSLKKCSLALIPTRFGGVLCVVKDQHVARGGLGGNDARILRHVARSVNFSLMVDLDLNLYLPAYRSKASKL